MKDEWKLSLEQKLKTRQKARELRNNATPSERKLWEALKDKALDGRKFRRQHPIGPFIADFYCASERLAIEVDGSVHAEQQEYDAYRQEVIEGFGIRVVRVSNEQVENQLDEVLNKIRMAFR
jgi:very-short-patch-repair endonuclease